VRPPVPPLRRWTWRHDHDLAAALEFAREVARAGGRIALRHYRRAPETRQKSDGTWVTEGDWATEAQVRLRIARAWPDHNVLGEEEGLSSAGGGPARSGAPTWVIDPIDGTNNYIAGIPIWATLIALRVDDVNVLGVCHAPALGETYDAAAGLGARSNDESIAVDPQTELGAATVCMSSAESFVRAGRAEFLHALLTRCGRSRGFGDFWGHMLVARGAAHAMIEAELSLWDVAALEPIVREAGGTLTHLDGSPWRESGSCLTTNGALHSEIVSLAQRC
jgi:histidinol-phosphatase